MVWSVVSCRGMCSALQGRCRAGSRGGDLPPVITEMWLERQVRMFGEGLSVKFCWGAWPGKTLWCLLSRTKSKEMLIVMPESVGWDKGDSQEAQEGES